jgi:hypothetical protein
MYPSRPFAGESDIETALRRVGELLDAERVELTLIIAGGAALNLLGIVDRTTHDVNVLAFGRRGHGQELEPPTLPLPEALLRAAKTVAADMNLQEDWIDTKMTAQLSTGVPPGLAQRLVWRSFSKSLTVGIVSRRDLIAFKLYAAVDDAKPESVHYQDLKALRPTQAELLEVRDWVRGQDASIEFHSSLDELIDYFLKFDAEI